MFERNLTEFKGITQKNIENLKYFSEINLQKIYNLKALNTDIKIISKISLDSKIINTKVLNLNNTLTLLLVDIEFNLKIQYLSSLKKVQILNLCIPHVSYIKLNKKFSNVLLLDPEILIKNIHYNLTDKNLLIHIYGINAYM